MLEWIANEDVAVLVSDYEMPKMTGAQLAGKARRVRPETVRILLTGMRTLETAIDGINQGEIFRFINKPFDDKQLHQAVLEAARAPRGAARADAAIANAASAATRCATALEPEYPGDLDGPRANEVLVVHAIRGAMRSHSGITGLDRKLES